MPRYDDALQKVATRKGIQILCRTKLASVRPDENVAVLECKDSGYRQEIKVRVKVSRSNNY